MRRTYSTKLVDSEGTEHEYRVDAFPFEEEFDFLLDLMGLTSPLAKQLFIIADNAMRSGQTLSNIDVEEIDFNLSNAASLLVELPRAIREIGTKKLFSFVFQYTRRSRIENGNVVWDELSQSVLRNDVYVSNSAEALQAVAFIIYANYAPFLTGITEALKRQLQKSELGRIVLSMVNSLVNKEGNSKTDSES